MKTEILSLFLAQPGEFVSGESISQQLGCSRTAVWKHIEQLKRQGYKFETVKKAGYRLTHVPDLLHPETILSGLITERIGQYIDYHRAVASTQQIAHQLAREGAPEGTLVIADEQRAGRGRMGRSWHSPPGQGIWMSLIIRPNIALPSSPQLTLLTSVAIVRCFREIGVEAGIKWPNDIYANERKLCGVLTELQANPDRIDYAIIGVGMNVNMVEKDVPDELKHKAGSLRMVLGQTVDRVKVIQSFCHHFEEWYNLYLREGFSSIRTVWEARSVSLGQEVTAVTAQGEVRGRALEIDDIGALVIQKKDGNLVKIYSADLESSVNSS